MAPEPGIFGLGAVNSAAFLLFFHLVQIGVFLVLLRYLDLYEREPFGVIVAMFLWGAVGATFISLFGNGIVSGMLAPEAELIYGAAISAPLVEEASKGLAVLVGFLVAQRLAKRFHVVEFGGVTDGIVFGAAAGFGFAFVEDLLYFVQISASSDFASGLEVFFMRVDFSGLGGTLFLHAVCTALTGAGLGLAVWARTPLSKVAWPVGGLMAAMALHANWNGTASFLAVRAVGFDRAVEAFTGTNDVALVEQVDAALMSGLRVSRAIFFVVFALLAVAFAMWLRHERAIIRYELAEETNRGLLTPQEYELMPKFWARTRWYWTLLRGGRAAQLRGVRRLHDDLVELAMLKWRVRRSGGSPVPTDRLRAEIEALRGYVIQVAAIADQPPAFAPPAAAPAPSPAVQT